MLKKLMKIVCAGITAVLLMTAAIPAQAATVTDFTDVSPGAWYYPAVTYAVENGLFAGTSSDTFSLDMGMTRGMFVTVLGRKNGVDKTAYPASRFSDVKPGDWYGPYVEWAASNGIVSGTGNHLFFPDQKISREQMAAILYRYAAITENDTSKDLAALEKFPDGGKVSSYAQNAMAWAVTHGVLKGSGGRLDPQGTATRAQVAQVFKNAEQVLGEKKSAAEAQQEPHIELTPAMQARLTAEQDPQEVLRRIAAGTAARWDESLTESNGYYMDIMLFGYTSDGQNTTNHAAFNALEYLNDTGADRYLIRTFTDPTFLLDGQPATGLQLIYTIPQKQDSPIMAEARKVIETKYPNAVFSPEAIKTGSEWRGHMRADDELSLTENASRVAQQEIEYLQEWHASEQTFNYWISEPEPGKFYFFY